MSTYGDPPGWRHDRDPFAPERRITVRVAGALLFLFALLAAVGLLSRRYFRIVPAGDAGAEASGPAAVVPEGYEVRVSEAQPPASDAERAYARVYEIATPGVVHITTRRYERSLFGYRPREGTGSGFVINEAGIVLTNYHVVQNAIGKVEVALSDGTTFDALWIRGNPTLDLAVLKIDPGEHDLHPLTLGESESLYIGQRVVAIGNPFGLSGTLTVGVVSALGRDIQTEAGVVIENVIQTDASINPGNSGGPLLNLYGHVVGINTAIFSPSGGSVGLGFAIGIDQVRTALPALMDPGEGQVEDGRGWLGVVLEESGDAVRIMEVVPDSPAAKAGLEPGYRIAAVDDAPVRSVRDVGDLISALEPGTRVRLRVLDRAGEERTRVVVLGRNLERR